VQYDPESDTPASVRTSNLNSDFGQVDFIFSDKTGTLTQNIMKLQQCSVNGIIYGGESATRSAAPIPTYTAFDDERALSILRHHCSAAPTVNGAGDSLSTKEDNFVLPEDGVGSKVDAQALDIFFTCLAVCHTVVVEKQKDGSLTYQAESPDEGALVYAAKPVGYELVDRTAGTITVSTAGVAGSEKMSGDSSSKETEDEADNHLRTYEILAVNAFDATRKRMSIIVREATGDIVLYCKGADNKMFEVLKEDTIKEKVETLNSHLDAFARVGLRTLVMGRRVVSESEFEKWSDDYDTARTSVLDRDNLLSNCALAIEQDLELIGASAIEDKLQDGVPDAIKKLRASGVSVWVLTGDKAETAKNIGKSCKLLTPSMKIIEIDKDDDEELDLLLNNWLTVLGNIADKGNLLARMWKKTKQATRAVAAVLQGQWRHSDLNHVRAESLALVVHGPTALVHILNSKSLTKKLLKLGRCCKSVIACRVSPSQKAGIVRMVKYGITPMPVTLAIGDGANDVSMIQEAHLGVGISGKEGLQAVNSSDVAIAQFRFLTRLLLVHGRWNYRRLSKVVLYSFYKNIALTVSTMFFQIFCGWSGQASYEEIVYTGFNFFLFAPILFIGVFDQGELLCCFVVLFFSFLFSSLLCLTPDTFFLISLSFVCTHCLVSNPLATFVCVDLCFDLCFDLLHFVPSKHEQTYLPKQHMIFLQHIPLVV